MSTVSRQLLACDACGHSGAAIWNFANSPAELVRVPEGFMQVGRGQDGSEYFCCSTRKRAVTGVRSTPPLNDNDEGH